jgi:hypothetical protein
MHWDTIVSENFAVSIFIALKTYRLTRVLAYFETDKEKSENT